MSDTALKMADDLDILCDPYDSAIAAELRRLVAENEALKAELAEQARLNGMGSEREAKMLAVNAELVESNRAMLRHCLAVMQEEADAYLAWNNDTNATLLAEIAALKEYLNDKG